MTGGRALLEAETGSGGWWGGGCLSTKMECLQGPWSVFVFIFLLDKKCEMFTLAEQIEL